MAKYILLMELISDTWRKQNVVKISLKCVIKINKVKYKKLFHVLKIYYMTTIMYKSYQIDVEKLIILPAILMLMF